MTTTRTVALDGVGEVPVTYDDDGAGPVVLLLHGGGGPVTVASFAQRLAQQGVRVVTPVHPGFEGTPRPDGLHTMSGLGALYLALLAELDLRDVTVVGNSIGGWITAEMAVRPDPRVAGTVLVDAAGLQLDDAPVADFFSLTMSQVADLSYYRPDDFRIDVAALPAPRQAAMAGNRAALELYAGHAMCDPTLLGRLPAATGPALIVWGAADRMIPLPHGRAYAHAMADARLQVIDDAGHLPQLETPDTLAVLVTDFLPGR